ncbi:fatty acid synthase-like [Panonychus citri]|uniref:fatty acid synthase-like n=1 Tax=Panonychus citri TaxID=50023 RepID=UPI0023074A86|nr:fatty acid synthase-like [Panonychus citri]
MVLLPYNSLVISGLSGRYPESRSLEEFWSNLVNGHDVATIDDRRWPTTILNVPKRLAKVPNIDLFDAEFFKLPPVTVSEIIPTIRVMHEVIYEMFIDAGFAPDSWLGSKTGIFAGVSERLIVHIDGAPILLGCPESINWLSYVFDFKGPVLEVDTACAAGASAFDIATRSILNGDCDQAIVLGHNHCFFPFIAQCFNEFGMTSSDGKSKCLDASANGYLRSENIVAVLIQRKFHAKRIYAEFLNLQVNCDGFTKEGITFPRLEGQIDLFKRLFKDIHLDPTDIDYVEGHITGTKAGDPVECKSLMESMRPNSDKPLLLGCLKSNIGHAEGSAVLNAISKVIKIFQTGVIPANLHFKEPNPNIDGLIKGVIKPILENTRFNGDHIMVNAFGFGGVNTSIILRANSKRTENIDLILTSNRIPRLVNFNNRTYEGLEAIVKFATDQKGSLTKYTLALLDNMSKISSSRGFNHRGYLLLDDEQTITHHTLKRNVTTDEMSIWFIFSPIFNVSSESFIQLLEVPLIYSRIRLIQSNSLRSLGIDVIKIIESNQQDLVSFLISSIAIQIALYDLLAKHLKIKPKGIIGHSIGLIAASYADGCITDVDALLIGYHIGVACKQFKGKGAMAYVNLPWRQIKEMNFGGIEIASNESEDWTLVTGIEDAIKKFISSIGPNVKTNIIDTKGIPFNSSLLANVLQSIKFEIDKFLWPLEISSRLTACDDKEFYNLNLNGDRIVDGRFFSACVTSPCNLSDTLEKLESNSVLIGIGSYFETLKPSIFLLNNQEKLVTVNNYEQPILSLYKAIGQLYLFGFNPVIESLYDQIEYPVPRETQPIGHLIAWKHEKKWYDGKYDKNSKKITHLTKSIDILDPNWLFLNGHQVDGRILFPATGYLHIAWQMICAILDMKPDENPIEFYQVQIHRATQFTSGSNEVKFVIKVNEDLENFLIYLNESKNVCITGKFRLVDKPTIGFLPVDYKNIKENTEIILQKNDIYKEFRTRGYDYSRSFQGIEEASSNGDWGMVKDTGHWISFSDACLQVSLLASKSRKLIVPVYIDYVYMFPPETFSAFSDETVTSGSDSTKRIGVYFNQETGIGSTNGFILKGLVGEAIKRKVNIANHQIRNFHHIPFTSNHNLMAEEINRQHEYSSQCMQLIETLERLKLKQSDIIVDHDDEHGSKFSDGSEDSSKILKLILKETIEMLKSQRADDAVGDLDIDITLNQIYDKYSETLMNDNLFHEPETLLFDQITNIVKSNSIKNSIAIIFYNFHDQSTGYRVENFFNHYGFMTSSSYRRSDSEKAKLSDFLIVRDKSTYLMYKDTEPEVKCNQYDPLLKNLFDSLKEGGFCQIMTRTKLRPVEQEWKQLIGNNQQINFDLSTLKSIATDAGFTWICHKEMVDEGYCSVLLRRPFAPNPDQQVTFIRVKLDNNYDWIDKIKELSKDKNHKIWLTGGGYDNGLIGLIMCLFKDPQYNKGDLSSLRWFQSHHSNWTHIPKDKLIEDHEKIKIYYGSLNFRDILVATGRVPLRSYPLYDSDHYEPTIGIEFSGINSSGERVMGICSSSGLATSSIIQSNSSRILVPENWTLAEAATVPVVYLTAYYGLISRGNLRSGESVLIHAGSGGVGQAAISICLSRGCQVFTTVGTQEKKDFIKKRFPSIDEDHIGDSRSTSFEDMIMKMTDGRGVDLVLNSLSDDKLKASIRCLSDFGRFIEIGKYDMIQNTKMDSQFIDFNKTFHACCLAFLQDDVFVKMIPGRIKVWNNLIEMLKKESNQVKLYLYRQQYSKYGLFENQTAETFDEAVKPKAIACRYLDQLTRSLSYDIDYFVCFSSTAVEVKSIVQANYCFGNTAMENICRKRRLDGLHGLAIRWGAVGDVGTIVEKKVRSNAIVKYLEPIRLNLAFESLDKTLCSSADDYLFTIVSFSDNKNITLLGSETSLKQKIFHILGIKDSTKVDPQSSLFELGLDSLMAVEIKQALDTDYDYSLTTQEIRDLKVCKLNELEKKLKKSEKKKINSPGSLPEYKNILMVPQHLFIPLNHNGFGAPYFYFPDLSGQFNVISPVFESLSKPVIGISWTKDCQSLDSIDDIVNFYADSLMNKYPDEKTFNLIGYSLGGVLALKVAIVLQQKLGQNFCQNLIMMDSTPEIIHNKIENVYKKYEER